jgi:hypothetical protein
MRQNTSLTLAFGCWTLLHPAILVVLAPPLKSLQLLMMHQTSIPFTQAANLLQLLLFSCRRIELTLLLLSQDLNQAPTLAMTAIAVVLISSRLTP